MPPITTMNSIATAHMPLSATSRCAQDERSPRGPEVGSRQTIHCTARHSRNVARMPGRMPAANSLPILVSVNTP